MFGTLKPFTKTFRAPAAAEREFIYVKAASDRYDLGARGRHVARALCRERSFAC